MVIDHQSCTSFFDTTLKYQSAEQRSQILIPMIELPFDHFGIEIKMDETVFGGRVLGKHGSHPADIHI